MEEESNLIEELDLSFHPLTQKLWRDFELLFGRNGACGGCWCMYWKLRGKAFEENTGDTARQMQKAVVDSKTVPGLLAYSEGYPVGWIAVEPRSAYPKLAHSRVLKPVDDQPVWSITCFFVEKKHRRKGITVELLKAAVNMSKNRAVKLWKAIPWTHPKIKPIPLFTQVRLPHSKRRASWKLPATRPPVPSFGM